MSIQPDTWIKKMCKDYNRRTFLTIKFEEKYYGLSSMGYDVRISVNIEYLLM